MGQSPPDSPEGPGCELPGLLELSILDVAPGVSLVEAPGLVLPSRILHSLGMAPGSLTPHVLPPSGIAPVWEATPRFPVLGSTHQLGLCTQTLPGLQSRPECACLT